MTGQTTARAVLELRPGDQVLQPGGAWFTVAGRPRPSRGPVVTWPYVGGSTGSAQWLALVECRPARTGAST
ncbi:hypothetical protein [Streptomyces ipomoeae]|uniref:hypothetical protein n=1 Tax=Streptomyces ipomoeae TaxID=103232 RepID=UPI001147176E|nr:hypothetical protein [Streptomyces ipomoeae]TQE35447.1 hypothetical protein Sipo7851_14390 [Streptomyces ipomoeae]